MLIFWESKRQRPMLAQKVLDEIGDQFKRSPVKPLKHKEGEYQTRPRCPQYRLTEP